MRETDSGNGNYLPSKDNRKSPQRPSKHITSDAKSLTVMTALVGLAAWLCQLLKGIITRRSVGFFLIHVTHMHTF